MSALSPLLIAVALLASKPQDTPGVLGYYRFPTIHGNTVIFTSEGDLWSVDTEGGLARRLTTHPAEESNASVSPDGKLVAFTAAYEGTPDAYLMPVDGGVPTRLTFGEGAEVVGWSPDGKVLYSTGAHSGIPDSQVATFDPKSRIRSTIPLAQAHDGTYSNDGKLFFTRFAFQGSHTKRYQGGTAQNIWRWDGGTSEAVCLTADFKGTSRTPMWWNGRVYFESDRDGVMNIWSMNGDGRDLKQHTHHKDYDVQSASLDGGRIVYQHGADVRLLDVKTGDDRPIPIRLASDFDQMREKWVTKPMDWVSSYNLSPDGNRVALTARGQIFVAPVKQGRLIEVTRKKNVRYRDARFLADNKTLVALSDESGEIELWKVPATGSGDDAPEQLTKDGDMFRVSSLPSPDGKHIVHGDKNLKLYMYDVALKTNRLIAESDTDDFAGFAWSSDSKTLAYVSVAKNSFSQIKLYDVATGKSADGTTDRFNSRSPSFTADGKWLYFLSDRHLRSVVDSPWGPRAPEPYFDKAEQVFYIALQPGLRSPFQPDDELYEEPKQPEKKPTDLPKIVYDGLEQRIALAPIPPGNYETLRVAGDRLFFQSLAAPGTPPSLASGQIKNKDIKVDTVLPAVESYDVTADGKKIIAKAGDAIFVFDANGAPADMGTSRVDLSKWTFSFDPKVEWRQMFDEAWRLHRDYVYDPGMQGVDWKAMRDKYRPLVDRISDRAELADILGQMVGEVSLLHTFVGGGDMRAGTDTVNVGELGADWARDETAGGYRITRLVRTDPDDPAGVGPLLKPGVEMIEGDVIAMIDGVSTLTVSDPSALLRAKAGKQVRIRVTSNGKKRDVIAVPIEEDYFLRYGAWEYSRRKQVEKDGGGALGYLHLQAMTKPDYDRFAQDFFPVFDRQGLIVDVRHNFGGNIDSWVLEKLMRKAWMYWSQRKGQSRWNMQYAFRGKIVVLCDEHTMSDGEAFAEGFRRLGLGKVIGTRTWGGEVWLASDNILVDKGIATAAEFGVYGPEGKWLIEGHGVDPDIVIDNLPHATFEGKDAQLEAAIKYLKDEIAKDPNPATPTPKYPDKSFPPKKNG